MYKKLKKEFEKIKPLDENLKRLAEKKWDSIAKPLGSLGSLEEMVVRLVAINENLCPKVDKKAVLIFCADNGVVEENVTQTGSEVTAIVTKNFAKGIATVNSFARVCGADIIPVDMGVKDNLSDTEGIINRKIASGTKNMAKESVMTREECMKAILTGIELVGELKEKGYNLIMTGEMGIGNTTTSSAVLSVLTGYAPEMVTGKGAGLSSSSLVHKIDIIKKAIQINKPDKDDIIDVISKVGGFDIAGMCGAFLGGGIYRVPVVIDGFISAVSAACAIKLCKNVSEYLFASHVSAEPAGSIALDFIGKKPYINCEMCLGEGTGAIIGGKLFDFALAGFNEAVGFQETDVEQYKHFE